MTFVNHCLKCKGKVSNINIVEAKQKRKSTKAALKFIVKLNNPSVRNSIVEIYKNIEIKWSFFFI